MSTAVPNFGYGSQGRLGEAPLVIFDKLQRSGALLSRKLGGGGLGFRFGVSGLGESWMKGFWVSRGGGLGKAGWMGLSVSGSGSWWKLG